MRALALAACVAALKAGEDTALTEETCAESVVAEDLSFLQLLERERAAHAAPERQAARRGKRDPAAERAAAEQAAAAEAKKEGAEIRKDECAWPVTLVCVVSGSSSR